MITTRINETHKVSNKLILSYLNSLSKYVTIEEVISFVYLSGNKYLHVNYKSFKEPNSLQWVEISVDNVNNYLPTYRELLINQILT